MKSINQKKLALATGLTSVVFYLGCFLTMALLGKDVIVKLSNLIFHGMEFNNIIRMDIPLGETILGAFISFIFWGVIGYVLALIYNKIK